MPSQRSAYQSLLDLERSKEPFSELIVQAADIIGFNIHAILTESPCGDFVQGAAGNTRFTGKEEWVLRWLLKNLETQGKSARLDARGDAPTGKEGLRMVRPS